MASLDKTTGTTEPKEIIRKMQVNTQTPQAAGIWERQSLQVSPSKAYHALGVQAVIGRLQEDSVHLLKLVVHLLGLLTQGIPSDATKLKLSQLVEIQSCLQKILQRIIHKRVKNDDNSGWCSNQYGNCWESYGGGGCLGKCEAWLVL